MISDGVAPGGEQLQELLLRAGVFQPGDQFRHLLLQQPDAAELRIVLHPVLPAGGQFDDERGNRREEHNGRCGRQRMADERQRNRFAGAGPMQVLCGLDGVGCGGRGFPGERGGFAG